MSIYSDLNRRDARQRPTVYDLESVMQSVEELISQPKLQRLFRPDGNDVDSLLFDLDGNGTSGNPSVAWRIKNELFGVIQKDTRVSLVYNQTYVLADPENNTWKVFLRFAVAGFDGVTYTQTGILSAPA